ncbi:MAG: hypothetical protein WAM56_17480 [Acidobacteriaceae bacterium]
MPEPTPEPTNAPEPTPAEKPRCRAITTSGHRCKNNAAHNGHLCYPHAHHRNPVLPDPTHVAIPLLEDHASIQLVLSQVTHGLLTLKLDPERARAIIYCCQVAAATMPRPPRMSTPQANPQPVGPTTVGTTADPLRPAACGPWPDDDDDNDDLVYRLAVDDQGIICGDGDLPAPNAHWQPASPEATPWDLLDAAPNQSKPTPRSPWDPDTHCSCAICTELLKMEADPINHPHLQPVVNPFCKRNRAGCQGPVSENRCSYCEGLYKYDPAKYDRQRRRRSSEPTDETWPEQRDRVPHPSRPAVPGERVGSRETEPVKNPRTPYVCQPCADVGEPEPQPLPNPIPDQFPDADPMLNAYIPADPEDSDAALDLNASAARLAPGSWPPAPGRPSGNTQNLLPSNPFAMNKTNRTAPRGVPHARPLLSYTSQRWKD